MSPTKQSFYFRNCDVATVDPVEGVLKGGIPEWLEGTLVRNGSGIHEIGQDKYNHAFDGLSVLHRISIKDGKATYSNRPLESNNYKKNMKAGRIVVSQFGTAVTIDPCDAIFATLKSEFEETDQGGMDMDNCAVNMAYHGDQLYALTETAQTRRVDPVTLLPIGPKTVLSDYIAINSGTAHPHILPNGNVINMGHHYTHQRGPHYAFYEVPPKFNSLETCYKDAKLICEVPVSTSKGMPSYFHSFGITENKIIFIETPFRLNLAKLMNMAKDKTSFKDAHAWQEGQKSRFVVMSKETGKVHPLIYETDELFTFHHANAYEEDGYLIVDVAGYNSGKFVSDNLDHDTIGNIWNSGGSGRRYVLPLQEGNIGKVALKHDGTGATLRQGTTNVVDVTPKIFLKGWFEFPKINYKYNGLKYQFLYGAACSKNNNEIPAAPEPNLLVKIDLKTGEKLTWSEANAITGEPIFVANQGIKNPSEDDGVLIIMLLHEDDLKKVTLLILDAKNMKEISRTAFKTPGTVPSTFHGQWANARDQTHLY